LAGDRPGKSPWEPGFVCSPAIVEEIVIKLITTKCRKMVSLWDVWNWRDDEAFARWPVHLLKKHGDYDEICRERQAEKERWAANEKRVEEAVARRQKEAEDREAEKKRRVEEAEARRQAIQ
jgi:hypothetical protein